MDSERFDAVTRRLGGAASRREVMTGLAGGVLAALGLARATSTAAPPAKVTICHWDAGRGAYEQLTISERGLNGHGHHAQDLLAPDFTSAATCGDCTTACGAGETCTDGACIAIATCGEWGPCPEPCQCSSSLNGIFCYSNRLVGGSCREDADCTVAGSSCQFDARGVGRCWEIDCRDDHSICPAGSQCTAGVSCQELCTAA